MVVWEPGAQEAYIRGPAPHLPGSATSCVFPVSSHLKSLLWRIVVLVVTRVAPGCRPRYLSLVSSPLGRQCWVRKWCSVLWKRRVLSKTLHREFQPIEYMCGLLPSCWTKTPSLSTRWAVQFEQKDSLMTGLRSTGLRTKEYYFAQLQKTLIANTLKKPMGFRVIESCLGIFALSH